MDLSNFVRIEIPFISKNFFVEGGYKYKGIAHYVIRRNDKRIVFETVRLNEDQEIYGAANYSDKYLSKSYISSKTNKILKDTRLKMFDTFEWSYSKDGVCPKKPSTKFKGVISDLNSLIFKNGLTIKSVVGYITGSNPGGGLRKPSADEISAFWFDHDPIEIIYGENVLKKHTDHLQWKIFSSISNISNKEKRNNGTFNTLDWEEFESIEKIEVKFLFENNYKIIPWKKALFEEDYVDFTEGIASQNRKHFNDNYINWDILLFDDEYWKIDEFYRIKKHIDKGDQKGLKEELRGIWTKKVNDDIEKNLYKSDFVKDRKVFQRCHIVENKDSKILMDSKVDWKQKEEFINRILDENNYILLDCNLHFYWDKEKGIEINSQGEIKNLSLNDEEFNDLVGGNRKINIVYPDVLNDRRIELLEFRNKLKNW